MKGNFKEMAIKEFTCSICGATVTKPKSFALGNGTRACRTHETVITEREEKEKNEKDRLKKIVEKKEEWPGPSRDTDFSFEKLSIRKPNSYCWCCSKDGIESKQLIPVIMELMLEANQLNLPILNLTATEEDIENSEKKPTVYSYIQEKLKRYLVERNMVQLNIFQIEKNPKIELHNFLLNSLARATGVFWCCTECATQRNLHVNKIVEKNFTADPKHMAIITGVFLKDSKVV
jgi:hypothetical protein